MQNLILKETIKTASAWLGKDLKDDQLVRQLIF